MSLKRIPPAIKNCFFISTYFLSASLTTPQRFAEMPFSENSWDVGVLSDEKTASKVKNHRWRSEIISAIEAYLFSAIWAGKFLSSLLWTVTKRAVSGSQFVPTDIDVLFWNELNWKLLLEQLNWISLESHAELLNKKKKGNIKIFQPRYGVTKVQFICKAKNYYYMNKENAPSKTNCFIDCRTNIGLWKKKKRINITCKV